MASSVISNAGTRITFRLGDIDAKRFADGYSSFEAIDLQNLETGQAIARIERPENDFSLNILPFQDLVSNSANAEMVIQNSRRTYGTPKEEVEIDLTASLVFVNKSTYPEDAELLSTTKNESSAKSIPNLVQRTEDSNFKIKTPAERKRLSNHRYLQTLIKKMAESRGFKATIEAPTVDGKGRIDVLLERDGKRIGCEISDTTTELWEVQNIMKCIASQCDIVIECSDDPISRKKILKEISEKIPIDVHSRVLVLEPNEVLVYLDSLIFPQESNETILKGFRIKMDYNKLSNIDSNLKRKDLIKIISSAEKKK